MIFDPARDGIDDAEWLALHEHASAGGFKEEGSCIVVLALIRLVVV